MLWCMEQHTWQPTATPAETAQQARFNALQRRKQVGVVRVSVDHLRPARQGDGAPAPVASYGKLLDIDVTRSRCGDKSKSWIYRAMGAGDFVPGVYIGRSLYFPERWVDHWIAAQIEAQHPLGFSPAIASSSGAGLAA